MKSRIKFLILKYFVFSIDIYETKQMMIFKRTNSLMTNQIEKCYSLVFLNPRSTILPMSDQSQFSKRTVRLPKKFRRSLIFAPKITEVFFYQFIDRLKNEHTVQKCVLQCESCIYIFTLFLFTPGSFPANVRFEILVVHCLAALPHFQANLFHNIHCIRKSICSLFPSTKFFATSKIS